jgi:HK97 family phage prohead protease
MAGATVTRSFALDDIRIRSNGDGRTVEAYAAVFDHPVEINDQDGRYNEQIERTAFNRTLSHRGTSFGVFYNHGKTLYGTPSERASMPLGKPLEVRADSRGLLTVTRYNKTPLADECLEAIANGDLNGQSFTGRMLRSTPDRGPFRARGGELTTVTRQEIGLIEYGPTPFPAYETAAILGTRSLVLSDVDAMLLQLVLEGLAEGDAALDPIVAALTKTDEALDQAQAVIAQILEVPNPDADAGVEGDDDSAPTEASDLGRTAYLSRLRSLAARLDDRHRSRSEGAPVQGPAPVARPTLSRAQARARLYRIGVKP